MAGIPHVKGHLSEHCADDAYATLVGYEARGGYAAARRALGELEPSQISEQVDAAGLRDHCAAGLSAACERRLLHVTNDVDDGPSYLVCNANESEPGSFGDRFLVERAPHLLIEGMLIAARAIGAPTSFVYVRGEYTHGAALLQRAIDEARAAGVLGARCLGSKFAHDIILTRGGGAYICGQKTGLLESLEGRAGLPRLPSRISAARANAASRASEARAFGRPTTMLSVETLCQLPHIVARGADWFRALGTADSPGSKFFSVSGHVLRPGLYELPLGTPLDEIIFEHAGGVPDERKVKAVVPGGLSTPLLPAGQLDVPMTDEALRERDTMLGTAGIIVMDETTCMVRTACVVAGFFRAESCGQCTQCREGTGWSHKLASRIERGAGRLEDIEILGDIASSMAGQTLCSLSDGAAWPLQGLLRHFRPEFEEHVRLAKCSFARSFEL